MPPRRRAPAPIPVDIDGVRRKLAEGKIVRVGISKSAQFPDGGTGRVRHVGDPAVDGEEFVQVELSLNGMRDILPFTPADLTPATRGRPPGSAAAPVSAGKPGSGSRGSGTTKTSRRTPLTSVPTGERLQSSSNGRLETAPSTAALGSSTEVPITAGGHALPADRPGDVADHASDAQQSGRKIRTPEPAAPESDSSQPAARDVATPPAAAGTTGRAKPTRGSRRSPAVAITIATTDSEPTQWKIEARVGARVALRSGSVAPARVWELVRLLENEALTKAVGSILDDQRKAAQARANVLAAELAQVRAELEALPDGSK